MSKMLILAGGALLLWGVTAAAAQESGFKLQLDPLVIGGLETDIDTDSAKFEEYRDFSQGFWLPKLGISGADDKGERWLKFDASNAGRHDARYTLGYGMAGKYRLTLDYNKIPHRFGNKGKLLFTETRPGVFELPDATQAALQGAIEKQFAANRAGINFAFLDGLLRPFIQTASDVDIGLQRDRTLARLDFGSKRGFAWGLEYTHENRTGTRQYGSTFGFNNITELPEPIDYDTSAATVSGAWSTDRGHVGFGYRASKFENHVSTLYWDNPFHLTSSTDGSAYSSPGSGSIGGSNRGFADLAPENDADTLYVNGRFKLGGAWWAGGGINYTTMKQNDPLLPYTLNTSIHGENFDGSTFDPTNPANLPAQKADGEVKVLAINADAGTRFAEDWGLTFRYRYYDYDNNSKRIEFPGYVRYHAVWEEIARVTVPYSYSKDDIGAELTWDMNSTSNWSLSFNRQSWSREFREVDSSDDDTFKLSFDTRPLAKLQLRASYEIGDRSTSHYDVEAAEATFLHPEGANNVPTLRRFDEAARDYDQWRASAQWSATDTFSVFFEVSGRSDDYKESLHGLQSDEIMSYNLELGWTPREGQNLYLFGSLSDRDVDQKARQSGATVSTNPLDDWSIEFTEVLDTWGLGWTQEFGPKWDSDLQVTWSNDDGKADFTAFAGGAPLASPRRTEAQDIPNYEDVELLALKWKLQYALSDTAGVGLLYRYEDFTGDSFISQGVTNYLPGALLIAADNGDYTANVFGLFFNLKF
jgi:MtrB/PioB family decaheme-associated outer membrane protein